MMNCIREVNENVYWIGGNDRRLSLFENIFQFQGEFHIILMLC